jgi:hypothetical protein
VEWIHVNQGRLWGWCGVDSYESREVKLAEFASYVNETYFCKSWMTIEGSISFSRRSLSHGVSLIIGMGKNNVCD